MSAAALISVEAALALVLSKTRTLRSTLKARDEAVGYALAENITSDIDSPPHDKSTVDGYAVRGADLPAGQGVLTVLEEVVAGALPTRLLTAGTATRIMTGAPLPEAADAVVMVERTKLLGAGAEAKVEISDPRFQPGQNILRRAVSIARGDMVLRPGVVLRPIEIGLLAEVGRSEVRVVARPVVGVLSTGNELVPADEVPPAGKIRNSNEPLLAACVQNAGGIPMRLGIGRDDPEELRELISEGLKADVLVLSGGVSAGVLDLVPGILASLGVEQVFHKVNLKPGKPLWFGVLKHEPVDKLVFGLPGNPVSSYVCCELFARPAIARLAGRPDSHLSRVTAGLTAEYLQHGDRPTFAPAIFRSTAPGNTVEPLPSRGSADLRGLAAGNALACFPAGDRAFAAGEQVDVVLLG